jgi:hypothetical protein
MDKKSGRRGKCSGSASRQETGSCESGDEYSKMRNFLTSLSTRSFSRYILLHEVSVKHCGSLRLCNWNKFEINNVTGCKENTQYCAAYKLEKKEIGGACSACGERRSVYRGLVGRPEGKAPLGRTRRRGEKIKMDFQEVICGGEGVWNGLGWLGIVTGGGDL